MTILLTGGNGKTSSRLAPLLKQEGFQVLVASRSGAVRDGIKSCRFDWLDESTYANPFEAASDISALYIVAPRTMDMLTPTKGFIDYALKKGVKRFVLLSASSVQCGDPAHGKIHEYIKSLNVEYGVLRPTWFMQNFSEAQHLTPIRDEGKLYSATNNGRIPFVSTEDIACVAKHLLTDEKPHNTDYVVLGPELLSYDDVAKIMSGILKKPVEHVKLSGEELSQWFQDQGVPSELAGFLSELDVKIGSARAEERLNTAIKDVTGKEAVTFQAFAEANKNVWV
ncbi:MAG: hypothetical protein HETSPECPRED_008089 [Heterodermia speciosa]|uniref:NmrA-like domain-containing protein n=1 Tax=Heterodermia speciosa TaxID=116794 RepID=A0A8H3EQ60_9LECA|nr:MAG: hypothetical protein HETSPECPRED_008089 [Heterodermia speciosa]